MGEGKVGAVKRRLAVVVFAFAARFVVYFNLFTFVIELSVAPCGMFDCY